MATALKLDPETGGTDIVVAVTQNPGIVLLDTAKFDVFYESLKAKAPTDADVSTTKGRAELRSFASDVRSEKAAIDKARLRLTKEWRDMTAQANEAGKVIEQRLESLAVEVRKPLTDWEAAEKARVDSCREDIEAFRRAGIVSLDDTADAVRERGTDLWQQEIDPARFGEMTDEAQAAKDASVAALKTALVRLEREEADAAELAKLRAENEARAERERAKQEVREEAEREAEEARQVEARRVAAEQAEAERIAAVAREAEERARREAEEAAETERQRVQAEHDAAMSAERKSADAARLAASTLQYIAEVVAGRIGGDVQPFGVLLRELETKIVADDSFGDMRDQVEAARVEGLAVLNRMMEDQAKRREEEDARKAEHDRLEAEHNKKLADEKNRELQRRLKTEAKEAIMSCGVSEDAAQKVVLAIRAKEIPHVAWSVTA